MFGVLGQGQMIKMIYLYFREDGKLWVRTKSADSVIESKFPNPIIVGDDYDITVVDDSIEVEEGMPQAMREKTRKEIEEDLDYSQKRLVEYPDIKEQLDYIYHNGLPKWKNDMIKPVKDKYPK